MANADESLQESDRLQPSYGTRFLIESILSRVDRPELTVNNEYNRSRRYDETSGRYRIGPTFITKQKLDSHNATKPGKLKLPEGEHFNDNYGVGLLKYFFTFIEQQDRQEIDLDFIKSFLDSGVNINSRDEYGQTILHAIVRDWHADVALFAVRHNADVNVQDNYGRSPLHLASALNCTEVAKVLLENGANANLETFKDHYTPLHYAAQYNSIDVLKELLKFGGYIGNKDYMDRTPLFIASEKGSAKTAQFLLDIGAPSAVFDRNSNSAIAYLIEKIPNVAFYALEQHVTESQSQSEIYLNCLEPHVSIRNEIGKVVTDPLELISSYNDENLIMHPVIQKAIDVKWKLFGRRDTIQKLSVIILYLICWLVLAYMFGDSADFYQTQEGSWKEHGWKIVLEIIIIIISVYFFYKRLNTWKKSVSDRQEWAVWNEKCIRSQYVFCHPAWPGERKSLSAEVEAIKLSPYLTSKQKLWFVYECVVLHLLSATIITRVLVMIHDEYKSILYIHKFIFGTTMIISFIRLLKICSHFRCVFVSFKIIYLIMRPIIQTSFLYLQLYIPFVSLFWLMFGEYEETAVVSLHNTTISPMINSSDRTNTSILPSDKSSKLTDNIVDSNLLSLDAIFDYVYVSTYKHVTISKVEQTHGFAFHTSSSLFHLLVTIIVCVILVSTITATCVNSYKRCYAQASLFQAYYHTDLQKKLSPAEKIKMVKYYETFCNPLLVTGKISKGNESDRTAISKINKLKGYIKYLTNSITDGNERVAKMDKAYDASLYRHIIEDSRSLKDNLTTFRNNIIKDLDAFTKRDESFYTTILKLL